MHELLGKRAALVDGAVRAFLVVDMHDLAGKRAARSTFCALAKIPISTSSDIVNMGRQLESFTPTFDHSTTF